MAQESRPPWQPGGALLFAPECWDLSVGVIFLDFMFYSFIPGQDHVWVVSQVCVLGGSGSQPVMAQGNGDEQRNLRKTLLMERREGKKATV